MEEPSIATVYCLHTDTINRIRNKALDVFLARIAQILDQIQKNQNKIKEYLFEFPFGTCEHVQDEELKHQNNDFYFPFTVLFT